MSEVTQTIFAGDEQGRLGNCLQAAVASALDLQLDDVPPLVEAPDWIGAVREFAVARGYESVELVYCNGSREGPARGLAIGPSVRGVQHAVVVRDGVVAWDPHPSRSGLLSVSYWVEFAANSVAAQGGKPA